MNKLLSLSKSNHAKFKEPIFHLSHNYCLTTLSRQTLNVIFAWHTAEMINTFVICDKIATIVSNWYTIIFGWQHAVVHKYLSLHFKEKNFYTRFEGSSIFWQKRNTLILMLLWNHVWNLMYSLHSHKHASETQYAGLATAVRIPNCRVLIGWA